MAGEGVGAGFARGMQSESIGNGRRRAPLIRPTSSLTGSFVGERGNFFSSHAAAEKGPNFRINPLSAASHDRLLDSRATPDAANVTTAGSIASSERG